MLFKIAKHAVNSVRSNKTMREGTFFLESGELPRAIECFRKAIAINKNNALAHSNLGSALISLHQYDEGYSTLKHSVNLAPDHAGIRVNYGNALYQSGSANEAVIQYQAALDLNPDEISASVNIIRPLMELCEWDKVEHWYERMRDRIDKGDELTWSRLVSPFTSLFLPFSRSEQLTIAKNAADEWVRSVASSPKPWHERRSRPTGKRLKIGYLSSDFHDHATAHLTLGLYGNHDRDLFEIFCYSLGYPDSGYHRQKISADCDSFVEVQGKSSSEIAQRIAKDQIDILVDLKGYTGGSRPGVLALRPAPIQVNYLGYPGTMGAEFMDYLIADPIIIPEDHSKDYSETIIRLPTTYQPTDDDQAIASRQMTRSEVGLPENGFVFCCFNTAAKIDKRTFACWMQILSAVPGSVLWLLETNPQIQAKLFRAASLANVEPRRLVFAPFCPKQEHLARIRLADLFVDTFLYNAHTTTTDALWAGIPVLTLTGSTFASRVATSLVNAAGLHQLSTSDEESFVSLAIELAKNSGFYSSIREIIRNPKATPLFNTKAYVKQLEHAYVSMSGHRNLQELK